MTSVRFDPGSFKDPTGRVFTKDGRVFRTLGSAAVETFTALQQSGLYDSLAATDRIVDTRQRRARECDLPEEIVGDGVLEHEPIPFISYSYEWPFDMLRDAALLTLEILSESLRHGLVLKDATPFNVQFRDGKPVWIDLLSFVPYEEGSPWVAYAQFCSTQLYPLFLTAYRGVEYHSVLRGSLAGIRPLDMARLLGAWRDAFRPGILRHVWLPARFERSFSGDVGNLGQEFSRISFTKSHIHRLAEGLMKILSALRYRPLQQEGTAYYTDHCMYSPRDIEGKERFVAEALAAAAPAQVWDLGCNMGRYTQIAGRFARTVIGLDVEAAVINALYLRQKAGDVEPNLYCLVGDLTDPSPSIGWNLVERRSWRERGRADFFLALALVHHLVLRGNVPLSMVIDCLADIAPRGIVEFVPKDDPMFQRMLANREDVFGDYSEAAFERQIARRFETIRWESVTAGGRKLYEVVRRSHN